MNPLFLAHLLGDFLFQPYTLVKFKEKSNAGIAVHALIHFVLLNALWFPRSAYLLIGYIAVALTHAFIDRAKITVQKSGVSFGIGFFVDQVLHFLTLFCVMVLAYKHSTSPMEQFWLRADVQFASCILAFAVYLFALYNIVYKQKNAPGLDRGALISRVLVITTSFALFTLLPFLFLS